MSPDKSIRENYIELCDRFRSYRRDAHLVECKHCKKLKADHLPGDERCDFDAMSKTYKRSDADLMTKNERCLEHLEEFMKIMGWM